MLLQQVFWIGLAWFAGTAAILGSLMTLGSLLLLQLPRSSDAEQARSNRRNWLKLFAVSLGLAIAGLGGLAIAPFPN